MDKEAMRAIGLSDKAGQIYLTTLSLGTASVQQIASKAGVKRSTAYAYIDALLHDGLLEKVPRGKKIYYRAADPLIIKQKLESSLAAVTQALPQLQALRQHSSGSPSVRVMEGATTLRQLHAELSHAHSLRFFSDLSSFEDTFSDLLIELSHLIQQHQIRTREIITDSPAARRSAKRYAVTAGQYYSARIAHAGSLFNNSAMYGNVVLLFRIQDCNLYAIRIEDVTIATSLKTLFDMAWQAATPFIP